jgi:AraC-like DNA-binding protein
MDALASLLDGPRARGAFLLRVVMDPPFCIQVEDHAPLSLMAVTAGSAVLTGADGTVLTLAAGDVALARGPETYSLADAPDRDPQILILPGGECATPDGVSVKIAQELGVRSWGTGSDGSITILVGTYERAGEVSRRVIDALPPLAVVRGAGWDSPLADLLATEIGRAVPGQEAVLDRLLDLLLVAALREWFDSEGTRAPAWYRAHADPVVGQALRLLGDRPADPWTVASLAREVGVSRATLARRFTEEVGETPMAFLTESRLALAADLLCDPKATVAGVARQVGYGSGFALSAAFSRERGISPTEHRTRTTASSDESEAAPGSVLA